MNWNDEDLLTHISESIEQGDFKMSEAIKLSNTAASTISVKRELSYMYEDSDIEGYEEGRNYFYWLDQYAPDQFVLIETGDYIIPPCADHKAAGFDGMHIECQTYDAHYHLYLVPASVWSDCRDQVMKVDAEWRAEQMKCKHDR